MGVRLMVSVWPTVDTRSETYREMADNGYLVTPDRGLPIHMNWMGECSFFDATHPGARALIWKKAKENYYRHGVRVFWLDEAEPEYGKYDFDIQRYHLGPALTVGNCTPRCTPGLLRRHDRRGTDGRNEPGALRGGGRQRYGARGPGPATWIRPSAPCGGAAGGGASMAMAGIPWWNSDLGGFSGGQTDDPAFRELLARWFAWGAFTPVMRMHGDRLPYEPPKEEYRSGVRQFGSGAPNEVWSFGAEMQTLLSRYILLREALRPYLRRVAADTHATGAPMMRPLFYDFPVDPAAWREETAYMLGADLLVAPVLEPGVAERGVYLPAGVAWVEQATGKRYEGGARVTAFAPLGVIPVFAREGSGLDLKAFFQ
jgi:alpha-D-xyloside xylohydrolase